MSESTMATAPSTSLHTPYPQLSGNNYSSWKFRLQSLLEMKEVLEVTKMEEIPEGNKAAITMDAKARATIIACITDKHIEYVKNAKTAREMLKCLDNVFERKSVLSKLYLRRRLVQLKCSEDADLQDHFVRFDEIITDLEATGAKLEEDDKVCHLLLSLPSKFETVITVLETTDQKLTIDLVKSKLLDAELKLKNSCEKQDHGNYTFAANVRKCYRCGSTDHLINSCPRNNQTPLKRGSFNRRGRYNRRGNRYQTSNLADNVVVDKDDNAVTFVALTVGDHSELKANAECINFILDSGASHNLFSDQLANRIVNSEQIEPVGIKIADGSMIYARKTGTLSVMCAYTGKTINIMGLVVDKLPYNLLSVKKINEAGVKVVFEDGCANIMLDPTPIKCNLHGNLFIFQCKLVNNEESMVAQEDLWHLRLGHVNRRGLQLLNLPFSEKVCDSCQKGKAVRKPFKSQELPRSKRVGELLFADVWGPADPPTLDNEKYYLSILDDFSHFTSVYLMKEKSEAEGHLINYIQSLRTKGFRVQRLRTDRGGEFKSSNFQKFCLENGISQEFTAGYTPQQCGAAERLNLTLLNKVRAMFCDSNLPKYLWGEAIRTAAYQLNRSPSNAIQGRIPAEIFLGKRDLSRLRVFGSKAWYLLLPKGNKLEPRGRAARMVGYSGAGYRLWDPMKNSVVISRDVNFDEGDFNYAKKSTEPPKTTEFKYLTEDNVEQAPQMTPERSRSPDFSGFEDPIEEEKVASDSKKKRKTCRPGYLKDYEVYSAFCLLSADNPQTYAEALKEGWSEAINKELEAHKDFKTWTNIEDIPAHVKPIETKWIFTTKNDGTKKARLVAKGYQEEQGNFHDFLYSPVAKLPTIRLALSFALQEDWHIHQMDIPTAFLNGTLDNEVYIYKPEGVEDKSDILKLQRALYGLREAPKCWNDRFSTYALSRNFIRSNFDACLYIGKGIWLILWVDDILLFGNRDKIKETMNDLKKEFNAKDMGNLECFIGTEIRVSEERIELSQQCLIEKIVKKFGMTDAKTSPTPMEEKLPSSDDKDIIEVPYRELVGSLIYLAQTCRPDIAFATSFLSRFLDKPTKPLWHAAKRVVRYLKGTKNLKLVYGKGDPDERFQITTWSDADWGGDQTDRKSCSGMSSFHCRNLISWISRKQPTVALSSAEAEYTACALAATELLYLKGLISDFVPNELVEVRGVLLVDNQGAIHMIKNYENTKRSKHIDIKYHFIKDIVSKRLVFVDYVDSKLNIADIFTKALGTTKFTQFRDSLCLL